MVSNPLNLLIKIQIIISGPNNNKRTFPTAVQIDMEREKVRVLCNELFNKLIHNAVM